MWFSRLEQPRKWLSDQRRGAVVVEAAICMPLFGMLLFSTLEIANAIYIRQVATTAAYEGVRIAAAPGGTQAAVAARVQELLASREIDQGTVTIVPELSPSVTRGTYLRVIVTIPANTNAISPLRFFSNRNVSAEVVMTKL